MCYESHEINEIDDDFETKTTTNSYSNHLHLIYSNLLRQPEYRNLTKMNRINGCQGPQRSGDKSVRDRKEIEKE